MTRLTDMLAGGGWLLLVLFGRQLVLQRFRRWRHNRAIDRAFAAGNASRAANATMNRQQRRAAERAAKKGKRP